MSQTEQIKIAILELKYVPDEANEENVRSLEKDLSIEIEINAL